MKWFPARDSQPISLCPSSRRSSDQLDLMVDGLPVSLPSYEEAVYGSWGQRLPACSVPGPTQLLLAQEPPSCHQSSQSDGSNCPLLTSQSPENPPPPYEEVQSSHLGDRRSDGDVRQLHVALSDDKDTWLPDGAVHTWHTVCGCLTVTARFWLTGLWCSAVFTPQMVTGRRRLWKRKKNRLTDSRLPFLLHFSWVALAHQHQDTCYVRWKCWGVIGQTWLKTWPDCNVCFWMKCWCYECMWRERERELSGNNPVNPGCLQKTNNCLFLTSFVI